MSVSKANMKDILAEEEDVAVADASLSEAQIRAKIEAEYAVKLSMLEEKLNSLAAAAPAAVAAAPTAKPANNYDFGVNPFEKPVDNGTTLVHFLEDGFTIGSLVYYRGQESLLPELEANYNTREQIVAYGRVMYRLGPWDGDEYDVDNPALTDRERAALIRANEARRLARR